MIPCASCGQPTTVALVVTSRTGESSLCWRCWRPQPAAVRQERPVRGGKGGR